MDVFAMPFRFVGGRAATVPADSQQDVEQCVEALLRTERDTRLELPEYGIPPQLFRTGGPDPQPIREAIATWEPRAQAAVEADASDLSRMIGRIQVNVQQQTTDG